MTFVDTNFFLRFLIKDNLDQHSQVVKLFEKGAEGKEKLFSSTIVFFEVNWVMSSYYEKNKTEIVTILKNMLFMTFIEFSERKILDQTLHLFERENIDLEDAYNISFSNENKATTFATFDQKLKKLTKS